MAGIYLTYFCNNPDERVYAQPASIGYVNSPK